MNTTPTELALERRLAHEGRLAAAERAPKLYPPVLAPVRPGPNGAIGWWEAFIPPTAGAWVPVWSTFTPWLAHEGISFSYAVRCVGGAGDLRVHLTAAGAVDVVTSSRSYADPDVIGDVFRWLHGLPLWDTVDVTVALEARVTADFVSVFPPYGGGVLFTSPESGGMTPSGI